ncbi:MAG: T9SS type A sorting domain-containing protein [Bacteroidales bacterium]|nr:T9SS type A sorting domain-containing protein [Bacteroidales bacterium]
MKNLLIICLLIFNNAFSQNIYSSGIGDGFDCNCVGNNYNEVPLPVSFGNFVAYLENEEVILEWETVSEINNDYFLIEKADEANNWEVISSINGKGNSNELVLYYDVDCSPSPGINYYRIRQVDFDGTYTFSKIEAVNVTAKENKLTIYPNPCNSYLTISSNEFIGEEFKIFNISGEDVSAKCKLISGTEFSISLDVSKLEAGIYLYKTSLGESGLFVVSFVNRF